MDRCELCGEAARCALPCAECGVDSKLCDACAKPRVEPDANVRATPYVCQFCVRVQRRGDVDAEPVDEPLPEDDGLDLANAEDDQREEENA